MDATIVLITGATAAVGKGFAEYFGAQLCDKSVLVLTSRSKQRVAELASEIGARNTEIAVVPVELDLTRPCKDQFEQDVFSVRA